MCVYVMVCEILCVFLKINGWCAFCRWTGWELNVFPSQNSQLSLESDGCVLPRLMTHATRDKDRGVDLRYYGKEIPCCSFNMAHVRAQGAWRMSRHFHSPVIASPAPSLCSTGNKPVTPSLMLHACMNIWPCPICLCVEMLDRLFSIRGHPRQHHFNRKH